MVLPITCFSALSNYRFKISRFQIMHVQNHAIDKNLYSTCTSIQYMYQYTIPVNFTQLEFRNPIILVENDAFAVKYLRDI